MSFNFWSSGAVPEELQLSEDNHSATKMQQLRTRSNNNSKESPSRQASIGRTLSRSNSIESQRSIRADSGDDASAMWSGLLSLSPSRKTPSFSPDGNGNDDYRKQRYHHRHSSRRRRTLFPHKVLRDSRVRWSLLSPSARCALLIVLPMLVFYVLITTIDQIFQRAGGATPVSVVESAASSSSSSQQKFSVVINTYKRPRQLADCVRHYADTCGQSAGVGKVYVVWAEEDATPPEPDSFFRTGNAGNKNSRQHRDNRAPVQIIKVPNSLNSRFLPIDDVTSSPPSPEMSQAIFMVDDDIRVDCNSLHTAFLAWKLNSDSMVGYYPRLAAVARSPSGQEEEQEEEYVYHAWPIVFWRHQINFILTKACFLHKRYLELYSSPNNHPQEIRDYVDKYFNCEDVAMSLLVANVTRAETGGRPALPIYVEGSVSDKGLFNGISTGTGHHARRSECLTDLTRIYVEHGWSPPLREIESLRTAAWVHHVPGFRWQYRPSNFFEWFALANVFK